MSISGISNSQVLSYFQTAGISQSAGVGQDSDGDSDGSSSAGGADNTQRKHSGIMQGLMQTLGALGLI